MNYVFFAIATYIFMRAFEVIFSDQKDKLWYKVTIKIVGAFVLYAAASAMLAFYFEDLTPLGFSSE